MKNLWLFPMLVCYVALFNVSCRQTDVVEPIKAENDATVISGELNEGRTMVRLWSKMEEIPIIVDIDGKKSNQIVESTFSLWKVIKDTSTRGVPNPDSLYTRTLSYNLNGSVITSVNIRLEYGGVIGGPISASTSKNSGIDGGSWGETWTSITWHQENTMIRIEVEGVEIEAIPSPVPGPPTIQVTRGHFVVWIAVSSLY